MPRPRASIMPLIQRQRSVSSRPLQHAVMPLFLFIGHTLTFSFCFADTRIFDFKQAFPLGYASTQPRRFAMLHFTDAADIDTRLTFTFLATQFPGKNSWLLAVSTLHIWLPRLRAVVMIVFIGRLRARCVGWRKAPEMTISIRGHECGLANLSLAAMRSWSTDDGHHCWRYAWADELRNSLSEFGQS